MPELPEVETTRRGLLPLLDHATITAVDLREARLRWPFQARWTEDLAGQTILSLSRRAKYLLLHLSKGTLIAHLGMSGSLRCVTPDVPLKKHDHITLYLDSGLQLRYHDPRRFGCLIYTTEASQEHPLLASLGPEPLSDEFSGSLLFSASRGHRLAVKNFIMDQRVVVGVGNIYANEALFKAGIRPTRAAGRISLQRYQRLAACIRATLEAAIEKGGTTLRDFIGGDGEPGYFQQTLLVYGRAGLSCTVCQEPLQACLVGQRSTVFCPCCQT